MTSDNKVFLRKCQIDGEILFSVDDFVRHGIKHSDSFVVTDEEFKLIRKERRERK